MVGSDQGQLPPMLDQVEKRCGERPNEALVDGGFVNLADIDTVQIDTADPASVHTTAKNVLARHPDLNVVIAMAGAMNIEDWHHPETFLDSAESVIEIPDNPDLWGRSLS